MDKNITITTITPCHNSSDYLEDCWNSLKTQSFGIENMQIIFVDDASDDGGATLSMLEDFERQFPDNVLVICLGENRKQGGARNEAMKYAKGRYIQFLDSDDTLKPNALERLWHLAGEYDADLIHYHSTYLNDDRLVETADVNDRKAFLASGIYSCGHSHKFYKRELIERTGSSFAENLVYEEPKFVYPLYFYTDRILFLKESFYNTRVHEHSTMGVLAANRLLDHPKVQLQLLDFLLERPELYNEYHLEIEEYFIWSFFYETMANILHVGPDKVGGDQLLWLKNTVRSLFPTWRSNPYIMNYPKDRWEILSLIDM